MPVLSWRARRLFVQIVDFALQLGDAVRGARPGRERAVRDPRRRGVVRRVRGLAPADPNPRAGPAGPRGSLCVAPAWLYQLA